MMTTDPIELAAELIRRPSVTPIDEGALASSPPGWTARFCLPSSGLRRPLPSGERRSRSPIFTPAWAAAGRIVFCRAYRRGADGPGGGLVVRAVCGQPAQGRVVRPRRGRYEGAIAAFIAAAERFLAARGAFTGSISLLITGDEEAWRSTVRGRSTGCDGAANVDACVVGEPTSADALGDMIKIGRRGSMTGRLMVEGVQGHVAYPHLVDNAAHRLVALLHALISSPAR